MQQRTPPQGRLFPDKPEQQAAPRFASTNAQPYEPQVRMQHSGRLPVYNAQYTTGSMQALHGTQPVQSMPPLAAMPTAQTYQTQQLTAQQAQQEGAPVIVQTIQGVPVLVSMEELKKALGAEKAQPAAEPDGKRRRRREKQPRRSLRFSLLWTLLGLIGLATVLVQTARYVVIPLLVHFF